MHLYGCPLSVNGNSRSRWAADTFITLAPLELRSKRAHLIRLWVIGLQLVEQGRRSLPKSVVDSKYSRTKTSCQFTICLLKPRHLARGSKAARSDDAESIVRRRLIRHPPLSPGPNLTKPTELSLAIQP